MYEKCTPKQAAHLTYGAKIRYARAFASLANSANRTYPNTFTPEEIVTIKGIEANVIARAEKIRIAELSVIEDPKTNRGSETEHRQYNGK